MKQAEPRPARRRARAAPRPPGGLEPSPARCRRTRCQIASRRRARIDAHFRTDRPAYRHRRLPPEANACLIPVTPPRSLCLLRLSAIGDTCHVVPIVRTLQHAWPAHAHHLGHRPDRSAPDEPVARRRVYHRRQALRLCASSRALRGRHRATAASTCCCTCSSRCARACCRSRSRRALRARLRPRARARAAVAVHELRASRRASREHVLDSFFGFAAALGVDVAARSSGTCRCRRRRSHTRRAWRRTAADAGRQSLLQPRRCATGSAERYAAVIGHAVRAHGMRVILCGGPTAYERAVRRARSSALAAVPVINQVGKDTLPQLLALLARATVLLTPDSGPAHMAHDGGHAGDRPVCRHPAQRSGPYLSREWCVDRYAAAAPKFRGRDAGQLPWTEKIEEPGRHGPDRGRGGDANGSTRCWRRCAALIRLRMSEIILVPISPGELLDKITILRIKSARMSDPAKLANVRHELDAARADLGESRCADRRRSQADEHALQDGQRAAVGDRGRHPRARSASNRFDASSSSSRVRSTSRTTSAPRSRSASTSRSARRSSRKSPTALRLRPADAAGAPPQRCSVYSAPQ